MIPQRFFFFLQFFFNNDDSHRHDARPPHARYGDRRDARTAFCFVLCVSTLISIQSEGLKRKNLVLQMETATSVAQNS